MKIQVVEDFNALSERAAELVERQIKQNEQSVLGLATGSTPIGLYEKMIEGHRTRGISYRNIRTINLDEYRGLGKDHPNSYHAFMRKYLFDHINIPLENVHLPNGVADSVDAECVRYEALVDELGPPHLQILGMGTNGHIGFNEPGTPANSVTHCVELEASTRRNNARFFDTPEEVPTHAITMGIASILKSEAILLLAAGKKKAPGIKRLLTKRISADFPASILWQHPNVTLIVDREAYALVEESK